MTPNFPANLFEPGVIRGEAFLKLIHSPEPIAEAILPGVDDPIRRALVTELWQAALQEIPGTLERLVFLAGLKDRETGLYRHFGLEASLGTDESHATIMAGHQLAFADWLQLGLRAQKANLEALLDKVYTNRFEALNAWNHIGHQLRLIPETTREEDRMLFLSDLETVLETLTNEHAEIVEMKATRLPLLTRVVLLSKT